MLDQRFFRSSPDGRPTEFGAIFAPSRDWLASGEDEEALDPTLPIVDSHHHLWDQPYSYQPADFIADADGGHRVIGSVFVECGHAYRRAGPVGVRPAGETEHVAASTKELPRGAPTVASAIVGFADLSLGSDVSEVLDEHIAVGAGRFRGIRFSTGWDASDAVENTAAAKRPRMLSEEPLRAALLQLAARDLSYDAWLFHTQLDEVAELADALPGLRIVLDHCGGPLGYGPYASGRETHFATWRNGMRRVAERPNVVCKLGGLLARGAAFDYVTADRPPGSAHLAAVWRPWILECIDAFGVDRCMFESNFPVEKMGVTYSTLWNVFKRITEGASPDERGALFAGTAARTYRLQL